VSWQEIRGHDAVVEQFRRSRAQGRLASTFLFVGPPGVGKRTLANKLAQSLLCERSEPGRLDPCGDCPGCQMCLAGTHPDVEVVSRPAGKANIPLELLIGDKEHRMQEGLCHRISLRPFRGGFKVAIIDDADSLNQEGANCLLKTLEEPPPSSVLILIGTSEQKQLPTIRSRCQVIRFRPLADDIVSDLLQQADPGLNSEEASELARLGRGSLHRAMFWRDGELAGFRHALLEELGKAAWDPIEVGRILTAFIESAGKDAAPRRERFRLVLELAIDYYDQLLRGLSGGVVQGDQVLCQAVQQGARSWRGDSETAALCLERCLDALGQLDANANIATLLECWLDDLNQTCWLGRAT
jgi:DNA polymerase-3 subunit delta'